jgi:putative GTP pyrophosphokinase
MAFPKVPPYSKSKINKAGRLLVADDPDDWELNILSEWRACHAYPINTFQKNLRDKINRLGFFGPPIVAQRLKRMPTIVDKLRRFPKMELSRMQDIGGVRAVVETTEDVYRLVHAYKNKNRKSRFEHKMRGEKDYIANPRSEDGYRSVHLIYEYKNRVAPDYDGLLLELQIRTRLQHNWATAVETLGIYLDQPLKSRKGDKQWLDYFALMSNAFAYMEELPLVPRYAHLSKVETFRAIAEADSNLQVVQKLSAIAFAARIITEQKKGFYHLIVLNTGDRTVEIFSYAKTNFDEAKLTYAELEKRAAMGEKLEPVLVAVGSISLLRRAYPNFFLDTREFLARVQDITRKAARLF